ncbi:hematopoietic progenitor cell antigen CD34 isoform X2 [Girardinichthys multiradiatus]|uniref:hematopoietic progenitor cell antigen CD34 isoform X2 n=1 Tax=Girardinichthys multiradiatus TaxID=208333 RepID=UPI001FADC1EA|nr:hematopoietic progenitor cell antigen CD34 isoform X2 [Girardinichthys multiradiatus]
MRMATLSGQSPSKMLAFALLLVAQLLSAGVTAQENVRGDGVLKTTKAPATKASGQEVVFPTLESNKSSPQTNISEDSSPSATSTFNLVLSKKTTNVPQPTPAPNSARGDNFPRPVDVVCVSKQAMEGKNAVLVKLKSSTSCVDTRKSIISVLPELCGEDCKLELYQEDNTDNVLVSGKYVEDDVTGMVNKFNNDNIKDKANVQGATPRWEKNLKLVLVSLLLTGLLLGVLLVALYYFKAHRKNSKGVRLAESFQVDEENQANTLVSVAPLHQEPADKPSANGESPPENGTNSTPTTNGHSANQTPVADTEM